MAEIVNLKRARKQKARAEAADAANANRLAHGRTKVEKSLTKAEQAKAKARLDAHKREG